MKFNEILLDDFRRCLGDDVKSGSVSKDVVNDMFRELRQFCLDNKDMLNKVINQRGGNCDTCHTYHIVKSNDELEAYIEYTKNFAMELVDNFDEEHLSLTEYKIGKYTVTEIQEYQDADDAYNYPFGGEDTWHSTLVFHLF